MGTGLGQLTGDLPRSEGIEKIQTDGDSHQFQTPQLSRSTTLHDLAKEGTIFFVHSALFVYGNWTRDPVADYVNVEDNNCHPFWITFDGPIFSGLDFKTDKKKRNSEWNYRLMGCPMHTWPGLLKCLQSLSGINKAEHRFHITVVQKIPMLDYLVLAKKATLPKPLPVVDLYTVGLLGNDRNVYFEPAKNPPMDKVRTRFGPPFPQIVKQGEEVLSGDMQQLSSPLLIPLEDDYAEAQVLASVGD